MKRVSLFLVCLVIPALFVFSLSAQKAEEKTIESILQPDFSDRKAVIKTIENFYIGDHTGSIKHKKLSMHEKGAYRYVNKNGEFRMKLFKSLNDDEGLINEIKVD